MSFYHCAIFKEQKYRYKRRIMSSTSVIVVLTYVSKLCSSFLCFLILLASINILLIEIFQKKLDSQN